jgi:serine/threonine protein kinase
MNRLKGHNNCYYLKGKESDFVLKKEGKFGSSFIAFNEQNQKVYFKEVNKNAQNGHIGISGIAREIKYTPENNYCNRPTDFFELGNRMFLVRPFNPGESLKTIIEQKILFKTLNKHTKVKIAIELCKAVYSIHALGIIHRDIRPSNFIVCNIQEFKLNPEANPIIKLIDFGMAQHFDEKMDSDIKVPFALIYSPPEQLLNKHPLIKFCSDIYALCLTLYELFTGEKAFYHDNPEFLMNLQLNNPISKHEKIDSELFSILLKGSYKKRFAKPPALLTSEEINKIIIEGQLGRYETLEMLINDLQLYSQNPQNLIEIKKPWYISWLD